MVDVRLLRQFFLTTLAIQTILLYAFVDVVVLEVRELLLEMVEELHVWDVARVGGVPRSVHAAPPLAVFIKT